MQAAGFHDFIQLTAQAHQLFVNCASVGLDLGFTRTTDKSQTTPLPFKVGPCPHQTCPLISQMRHFYLQYTLAGGRTIRKDFKDQTRSIKDLNLPFLFQITLLHGCN